MLTIRLEDYGQDFLEWDVLDSKVVDCRPSQSWAWVGTEVHNDEIRPGDILDITLNCGGRTTLNYPVKSVSTKVD